MIAAGILRYWTNDLNAIYKLDERIVLLTGELRNCFRLTVIRKQYIKAEILIRNHYRCASAGNVDIELSR